MKTMEIAGHTFPVGDCVATKETGPVPLLGIPMMSDYKWQLTSLQDRLEDPEKYRAIGEDVEEVVDQLRQWLEEHSGEAIA